MLLNDMDLTIKQISELILNFENICDVCDKAGPVDQVAAEVKFKRCKKLTLEALKSFLQNELRRDRHYLRGVRENLYREYPLDDSITLAQAREHLKSLTQHKRKQFINEALSNRDNLILNAVYYFEYYLTGLNQNEHSEYKTKIFAIRNEKQLKELSEANEALIQLEKCIKSAIEYVDAHKIEEPENAYA